MVKPLYVRNVVGGFTEGGGIGEKLPGVFMSIFMELHKPVSPNILSPSRQVPGIQSFLSLP